MIPYLDIETSPNLAHVWGLWQQNVSLAQLQESSYMMCFAAKWEGEEDTQFYSVRNPGMIAAAWRLLDEADVVVHYNGKKFDIPILSQEIMLDGLAPPSPFKQVDLCAAVKKAFRFPSNKLDYVSQRLGLGAKVKHAGHELWVKCLAGDDEAWAEMETYNRQDVVLLPKLYHRILPWIPNHPNALLYYSEPVEGCTKCGSVFVQKRGTISLLTGPYQRYCCNRCGGWSRGTKRLDSVEMSGVLL
jgi:hypothetical protein